MHSMVQPVGILKVHRSCELPSYFIKRPRSYTEGKIDKSLNVHVSRHRCIALCALICHDEFQQMTRDRDVRFAKLSATVIRWQVRYLAYIVISSYVYTLCQIMRITS